MAVEWREHLSVGIRRIDEQHKELFRRFDALLTACNQRKGKEEVHGVLRFLDDYIRSHFAMEEQLQKKLDYPYYNEHKAQHETFIKDFRKLQDEFAEGGASLSLVIQTNQTLVKWFINHIHALDQALADYARGKA